MSFLDDIGLIFTLYFRFIFPIIVMYLWHRRFPKKNSDTPLWRKVLGWIVFFVVVEILVFRGGLFMWSLEYGQTFTTLVYALKNYNVILIWATVLMIVEYFYSLTTQMKDNKIWSISSSIRLLVGVAVLLCVNLLLMGFFNVFYRFTADTFVRAMFVMGLDLVLTAIVIFLAGRHYKRLTRLFSREGSAEGVYLKNNKIWSISDSIKLLVGVAILLNVNNLLMLWFNVFTRFNAETFNRAMFVMWLDLVLTAIVIFAGARGQSRNP